MPTIRSSPPRRRNQDAVPTNIRLLPDLRQKADAVAHDRYDWSLTQLVRALLKKEIHSKKGVVHASLK